MGTCETVWTCPTCQRRCVVLCRVSGVYHACKGRKAVGANRGGLVAFRKVGA